MLALIAQTKAIDFNALDNSIPGLKDTFKPQSAPGLAGIINAVLPFLFIIAGLLLFFYLIAAGFQMMTSPGDEKAAASAKAKITNALAGFIILFVSFWLVKLLGYILGLELL